MATSASSEHAPRLLSAFDATLLVLGGIVGVGIFFTPRAVAEALPWAPAFLGAWALGGLAALAGAFVFAELGGTFPKAGGWFVFLHAAFGPLPAFLFACVVLVVVSTGATAVMLEILVANLAAAWPALGSSREPAGLALGAAVVVGVSALAWRGSKSGARFQNTCMALKLAAIAALVAGGLALGLHAEHAGAATPVHPPSAAALASGLGAALLPVLFACGGWQHVCYLAHQVRAPARTVPRAIVLGVACVIALYLALNLAYVSALGVEGIARDAGFAGRMAEAAYGPLGARLLRVALAISALGVCTVTLIASPFLYVAMAREGLFFERFGRVDPTSGAPRLALVVQALLALGWWLWGRAERVVDAVVFVEWIFHALAALALLSLRRRRPALPRPFASPLYPLAPLLYLALALVVVGGTLWRSGLSQSAIGLGVLAGGLALYAPWRALVRARGGLGSARGSG